MMNKRLSVLWLAPFLPYPPSHGGAVRIFNLIKGLAGQVDITLLALTDGAPDPNALAAMAEHCCEVQAFPRSSRLHIMPTRLAPPAVYLDDVPAMHRAVRSLQERNHFDVLQVDYPSLSTYLAYRGQSRTFLTELDVTYLTLFRRFLTERSLPQKARRLLASATFFHYEMRNLPRYDTVITMSEYDRQVLARRLPRLQTAVIPNGVDCDHFEPPERLGDEQAPALFFVGNFTHPPNVDAVLFFIRKIWPELSARFPTLRFIVVGEPTPEIRAIAGDRIELVGRARNCDGGEATGFVSDIRTYYTQSSVVVVPIRWGSGTRLKVLEAFAAGIPVVSTSLGAEGVEAEPDRDYLVADSPPAFVEQVSRLLVDRELAEMLRQNARRLVETRYDWRILAAQQLELYERACHDRRLSVVEGGA